MISTRRPAKAITSPQKPTVAGASVSGEVLGTEKGEKLVAACCDALLAILRDPQLWEPPTGK